MTIFQTAELLIEIIELQAGIIREQMELIQMNIESGIPEKIRKELQDLREKELSAGLGEQEGIWRYQQQEE